MMDLEAPWVGHSPYEDDEEKTYYCPVCGHECEKIYSRCDLVLGCDYCIDVYDAEDWEGWDE